MYSFGADNFQIQRTFLCVQVDLYPNLSEVVGLKRNTGSVDRWYNPVLPVLISEKDCIQPAETFTLDNLAIIPRPADIGLPVDSAMYVLMSQSLLLRCQESIVSLRIYTQSYEFL